MIQHFSLDNIGCLDQLNSPPLLQQNVLIFGENGSGKSTLVAAFRSLHEGTAEAIAERAPIGRKSNPTFTGEIFGHRFEFHGAKWNQHLDRFAIFDHAYINRNIHSGDLFNNDHKKQLYTVILGDACAGKLSEQADLERKITEHNRRIKEIEGNIERRIPGELPFKEFIKLKPIENVEDAIEKQRLVVQRFQQSDKLNRMDGFDVIELPRLPNSFSQTLSKTMQNLSADAEKRVNEHLRTSTNKASTQWIEQGLKFKKDDSCPFCGESTSSNALIEAYQDFFNEEYNALKSEVNRLPGLVDSQFGESVVLNHQKKFSGNKVAADAWKVHIEVPPLDHSIFDELSVELRKCRDRLSNLVEQKRQNPLESVSPADGIKLSKELTGRVEDYNNMVSIANQRIEDLRDSQKSGDLQMERQKLIDLEAAAIRHSAELKDVISEWEQAQSVKTRNADRRHNLQASIAKETAAVFDRQGDEINSILEHLEAGFRLGTLITNTRTKPPSVQLCIEIQDREVQLGDKVAAAQRPFRSVLSSSERTMLAFAFFVSKLKMDGELSKKVVIFDDPITSFDQTRLAKTAEIISEACADAAQLILLSHDAEFLEMTETQITSGVQRLHLTTEQGSGSQLTEIAAWVQTAS